MPLYKIGEQGRYLFTNSAFVIQMSQPQEAMQGGSGGHINDYKWGQRYLPNTAKGLMYSLLGIDFISPSRVEEL